MVIVALEPSRNSLDTVSEEPRGLSPSLDLGTLRPPLGPMPPLGRVPRGRVSAESSLPQAPGGQAAGGTAEGALSASLSAKRATMSPSGSPAPSPRVRQPRDEALDAPATPSGTPRHESIEVAREQAHRL